MFKLKFEEMSTLRSERIIVGVFSNVFSNVFINCILLRDTRRYSYYVPIFKGIGISWMVS